VPPEGGRVNPIGVSFPIISRLWEVNLAVQRILLIRHGRTDWNVEGRWQGSLPVPLNDEGRAQAQALGAYLRGSGLSAVYTSDLPRAFDTAQAVADALNLQPCADERLREFDLGIFQGLTRDEIIARYPSEWAALRENYWDYVIPGGESRRAMQNRMFNAWQDIAASAEGTVALVSHGGSIKLLLLRVFDNAPELQDVHIENTSITTVERNGVGWHLVELAATPHLVTPPSALHHPLMSPPEESANI
jgi:broad specificity phosphatase PhoE